MATARSLALLLVENLLGALASCGIYVTFAAAAWLVNAISKVIPISDIAALEFLRTCLTWGGVISAVLTWLVVTIKQLYRFTKEA